MSKQLLVVNDSRTGCARWLRSCPVFDAFKGVELGMDADEVREILGNLKEKDKEQDFTLVNLRKFLESRGYRVVEAVDGQEAVEARSAVAPT